MLRKWFKNLIAEAIKENFSPIHISVIEGEETETKLELKNGVFNNSNIKISKLCKKKDINLSGCDITQHHGVFLEQGVNNEEIENKETLN